MIGNRRMPVCTQTMRVRDGRTRIQRLRCQVGTHTAGFSPAFYVVTTAVLPPAQGHFMDNWLWIAGFVQCFSDPGQGTDGIDRDDLLLLIPRTCFESAVGAVYASKKSNNFFS